ncbi:MAG TPA: isoprenylcysteine carboxylmethyltransferase family protein [Bryobacteraceae bacterium]|nr:isoprenylcysteine carboxylmethyltransferase family protein [Bryobacteraceae bacterium]
MKPQSTYLLKIVLGVLFMLGAYCAGCGRIDLWPGWCYAAFFLVMFLASFRIALRVAPDLIVARVSWDAGAKRWDQPIVTFLMLGPIVTCLVAGLDARHNGLRAADFRVALGYVLAVAGSALTQSAVAVNRFYAPVMRIQKERGHTVVDTGPYRLVRHPGNMGNVILNAAAPLMLASDWAWIPAATLIVVTIVRTMLEDRALCQELPGYAAFAGRTRSRLIPGIW